ncbi:uncharacterized protein LOC117591043 [Drosophila guanche]|uniref:Uncharacterized protein n=1 Tax=Drosophila guanche TaxID=7266 RepID=A0A3B0KLL6_DROGU|nr:uncharacterized protein LOC117591043 [Drosophila guanche]SPP89510.1 Hypothetical predicted protein [Drosophila guanche]
MNPITTDNVPHELGDDISDIDMEEVPAQLEKTLKPTVHETKSLFNISIKELWDSTNSDEEVEEYKTDINIKQKKFVDYIIAEHKKSEESLKEYEATLVDLHPSCEIKPSVEQQVFLDQSPDIQNFIRGHLEFRNRCEAFWVKHEQMKELQARIVERFQLLLNQIALNAINQNLANEPKKPAKQG